tara:strand:+ start:135 stop:326 length:192 start_codon:yes stop_codon:yes gene_type:complete
MNGGIKRIGVIVAVRIVNILGENALALSTIRMSRLLVLSSPIKGRVGLHRGELFDPLFSTSKR